MKVYSRVTSEQLRLLRGSPVSRVTSHFQVYSTINKCVRVNESQIALLNTLTGGMRAGELWAQEGNTLW